MKPSVRIETERLLMRLPQLSDAQAIFGGYAQDSEVTRYLIWQSHHDVQETERFLAECIAAWRQGTRFPWVITLKASGELIGMVEMRIDGFKADVGYVIARRWWGRGLTPEASLRPSSGMGSPLLPGNDASVRVLQKLGFLEEGTRRDYLYSKARFHRFRWFALLETDEADHPATI